VFYQETMFAGQSERYVKQGSDNGQLSLHRNPFEERGGGGVHFIRDIEIQMIGASGNGASLSMGALRGEPGGMGPLLGKLKPTLRHVKEGFGNEPSLSF
jgi:hypothetical protein